MTHSPVAYPLGEDAPLLRNSRAQPQSAPRAGNMFRWLFAALGSGGVAIPQGYFSVTSFITKSTAAGGIFGAGTIVCAGSCVYCIFRVVNAIKYRNIQPLAPAPDMTAAKADVQMLRVVHTRLNTLLTESEPIDLEAGVNDVQLHEAINGQLQELEQILPLMRTELDELRQTIHEVLANQSVESPDGIGLDSPSKEVSFERGILDKLNALAKKVGRDQSSRNNSRLSSAANSPARVSFAASPEFSPVPKVSPATRRLTFDINGDEPKSTPVVARTGGGIMSPTDEGQ